LLICTHFGFAFRFEIIIIYDKNWRDFYGGNSGAVNSIREIVSHAQSWFQIFSLTVPFVLDVKSISVVNFEIPANQSGL